MNNEQIIRECLREFLLELPDVQNISCDNNSNSLCDYDYLHLFNQATSEEMVEINEILRNMKIYAERLTTIQDDCCGR